jgi:hypothetical protein
MLTAAALTAIARMPVGKVATAFVHSPGPTHKRAHDSAHRRLAPPSTCRHSNMQEAT